MNENVEIRKIPKKTIIVIVIMSILIVVGFIFITMSKNLKMEEILATLGHKNISNVKVINRLQAEDKETKVNSTVYKVVFTDNGLKKECIGFVIRSNRGKYSKDIDCK